MENIAGATFNGLGGFGEIQVGIYDEDKHDYNAPVRQGMYEMVSLMGNVSMDQGELFVHAHAAFSFMDHGEMKVIGGDLRKAVVNYTAELVLTPTEQSITRQYDQATEIDIWDLQDQVNWKN